MQKVITNVVGEDQTCRIRGRMILTNIDLAYGALQQCVIDVRKVALLQIDFEKDFDLLSSEVLFL